jgi:hypothetical protein
MNFIRVLLPRLTTLLWPHIDDDDKMCFYQPVLTDAQKQKLDALLFGFTTLWLLWWCGRPLLQLLWELLRFLYLLLKMTVHLCKLIWDDVWLQAPGVR